MYWMHWIMVGIAIGIGLMLAPLVVWLGFALLPTLLRIGLAAGLVGGALWLWQAFPDATKEILHIGLTFGAMGLPAFLLYYHVPAYRNYCLRRSLRRSVSPAEIFAAATMALAVVGFVIGLIITNEDHDIERMMRWMTMLGFSAMFGFASMLGERAAKWLVERQQGGGHQASHTRGINTNPAPNRDLPGVFPWQ